MPTSPDHPRPFLQRKWRSLDGRWDFHLDPDQRFTDPSAVPFVDEIKVPFAPETAASGIEADGFVQQCWYRRTLDVTPKSDERIIVHFGGVDRIADVWVDGNHVGHHVGGYSAFSVDITDHAVKGARLVVRAADDGHDLRVPRGKQDWNEIPHAVWYPRTTGIWKTVWLERVPSTRIGAIDWTADVSAMSVTARIRVDGPLVPGLRLRVRLGVGDRRLVDDTIVVSDREVVRTFALGTGIDDRFSLLWWPRSPTLIDASLRLTAPSGLSDTVTSYTALRSVAVRDGAVCLNGRPYPLRLVLDQGYWPDTGATPPSVAALEADIDHTLALGFNGARKHQKTEDARYFALADRKGLLTWVEMPSAYEPGPETSATLLREWIEIVEAHRNHPSVITWVPVNESWGVPGAATDPTQRAAIAALCHATDAVDGTRPVSANDGWETVGGSIVGVHDYDQAPATLRNRWSTAAAIDDVLTGMRPDGKLADLDRAAAGGRAVILSEFGGIALADDTEDDERFGTAGWGYDNAVDADDLLTRYRELWAVVHDSSGLAGACWTQLTDTFQEVNGLLRMDRTPKVDAAELREATKGRPLPSDTTASTSGDDESPTDG